MKHHIVSIGISRHQNAAANLQYAAKDATEFFELFRLNLPDQGYQKLLIDSEATLAQIRSAIGTELKAAVSKDDIFFFFYSGHGAVDAHESDPDTALNYLVPFDATLDFESSCISIEYIKGVFEDLPSQANFIFVDSCFSGCLSKHTKGYPVPKTKAFKIVRSFANTEIGNGTLIFTACKDDQESIEDPEYENGLFTYELLSELQMEHSGDSYDALTIFSPIARRVEERARMKWRHAQTPTFLGKLQGAVSFPVFKTRLKVTPELIAVPRYTELSDASFPIAQIQLPDKQKEKVVNDTLQLVVRAKKDEEFGEVAYERYSSKLLFTLKSQWEELFIENGGRVEELPNTVAKLEAASFQFILLAAVTARFGSPAQMKTYSKHVVSVLDWTKHKSGLVALISVPEILVANVIYTVGVVCLASEKLPPLGILMNTKVHDLWNRDEPPWDLVQCFQIFYCDAFGGYSNKVHDHIRDMLNSLDWLPELVPSVEGQVQNFQLQMSLLLSVWMKLRKASAWPDFGRFYADHVVPLVRKLKYDAEFRKNVGAIMDLKDTDVLKVFERTVEQFRSANFGSFRWRSVGPGVFLTQEHPKAGPSDK